MVAPFLCQISAIMTQEAKITITGEQIFEDLTGRFSISPSNQAYTLQVADSHDGVWCDEVSINAGDRLKFVAEVRGLLYKCVGNTDTLTIVMG